ncbi:MAG: M23 family metallopeptidase [Candidatus Aenigmatarchaeota archaeon]
MKPKSPFEKIVLIALALLAALYFNSACAKPTTPPKENYSTPTAAVVYESPTPYPTLTATPTPYPTFTPTITPSPTPTKTRILRSYPTYTPTPPYLDLIPTNAFEQNKEAVLNATKFYNPEGLFPHVPFKCGTKVTEILQYEIEKEIYPASFIPGSDFFVPPKTEIYSMTDGIVESVYEQFEETDKKRKKSLGWNVTVKYEEYKIIYGHLNSVLKYIKEGSGVKRGELIGYSATTENLPSPHLHLSVIDKTGDSIDPDTLYQSGLILPNYSYKGTNHSWVFDLYVPECIP